jgi:hypothetical protein
MTKGNKKITFAMDYLRIMGKTASDFAQENN